MELKLSHVRIDFHAIAIRNVHRFPADERCPEFVRFNLYDSDGNTATAFLTPEVAAELADKLGVKSPRLVALHGLLCDECGARFDGWFPAAQVPERFLCAKCAEGGMI